METPQKTVIQNGIPVSKLTVKNSPVFNYINSLSPIKPVKPILIAQTFGSLSSASPPSVFTSPHTPSRFKSSHTYSSDPSKELGEEALLETVPPQILKNDRISTPPRRATNDGSCGGGKTDLQKMCDDNVKRISDTPDWETLFPETPELLTYDTLNDSEADRCFLPVSSDSKRRSCGGTKPALEPVSNSKESADALHRGVRRRLLDFEMPNIKQTSEKSSSSCVVPPSTGLHLNAISMSSTNEYSLSGNIKVNLQNSTTPVLHIVRENETGEAAGQSVVQGVPKSSLALVEMNQSSPKKKSYCECFAAGVYCIDSCSCLDCFNKTIHEDTVLATRKQIESRNPLAFAPKVIRNADSTVVVGDVESKTPASARHKRGCNCRKSNCLKKYCECYQSGVGCSINCRCEGCKNAFGRKDGSSFVGIDIKEDGESKTVKTQQNAELFSSVTLPSSTPIMPLRQPLAQLPFSSNNMVLPQQSQQLHGASGSSLYESQSFRKQGMSLLSHSRIETITEDIENLIQSPVTNINAVSPNSKRVSLPRLDSSELTPRRRNVTQVLLPPSGPPLGEDNKDSFKSRLLKILDAQEENDTPGSRRLIADAAELLVFRSPNDSEAFTCLVDKISSSERRLCAGVKQSPKQHDITKEDVSANGSSSGNETFAVVPNQDTVPETLDQAEREPGEESAAEEAPKVLVLEELIPDLRKRSKFCP
ncbi:hypothetical protein Bca101_054669 [Brassica carinata]